MWNLGYSEILVKTSEFFLYLCNLPPPLSFGGNEDGKLIQIHGMESTSRYECFLKALNIENLRSHLSILNLFTVGGKGFSNKGRNARKPPTLWKVGLLPSDTQYWILLSFLVKIKSQTLNCLCAALLTMISKGNPFGCNELKLFFFYFLMWCFLSSV